MTMKQVCLIGGSGFIGGWIAERLAARGLQVTVATRQPERCKEHLLVLPTVRFVTTDIHRDDALAQLVQGHDAVISMVGILHGSASAFEQAHDRLVGRIIDACHQQGVKRLVHISALGAADNAPSLYQRSKARGEARVRDSQLDWTILRPSVVFGPGDSFLNLFASLLKMLPVLPLAGSHTRFQPVWVGDVARAVDTVLDTREFHGKTYDLTGPDTVTLLELVDYIGRLTGQRRLIIPLPTPLAMVQAALMECLPGKPLMSRDNVRSLAVDNVSPEGFPVEALGFAPASLQSIAPQWLGADELNAQRSEWRSKAGR